MQEKKTFCCYKLNLLSEMKTEKISYLWTRCYLRNGVGVRINWFSFWWFNLKLRILFETLKKVNNEKQLINMILFFLNFNIYQINIMMTNSTTYFSVSIFMRPSMGPQVDNLKCPSSGADLKSIIQKKKESTCWNGYILLTTLTVKSLSPSGSYDEKQFPV